MPVTDQIKHPVPNARARAIAQGLIGTGRASAMRSVGGFIRVRAVTGPDYWVSHSGDALLRGEALETAEEMQPGFLNAMARAGAKSGAGGRP
jgi:hypothetical protein